MAKNSSYLIILLSSKIKCVLFFGLKSNLSWAMHGSAFCIVLLTRVMIVQSNPLYIIFNKLQLFLLQTCLTRDSSSKILSCDSLLSFCSVWIVIFPLVVNVSNVPELSSAALTLSRSDYRTIKMIRNSCVKLIIFNTDLDQSWLSCRILPCIFNLGF